MKGDKSSSGRKPKTIIILTIVIIAAVAIGILNFVSFFRTDSAAIGQAGTGTGEVGDNDNLIKHIVPLDKIVSGGPPPDGIPSIDSPKFVSAAEADKFLQNSDRVVGLNIDGDIRAYPLQILVWHEIVNDKMGSTPIAVTYCPLCFTNQVFSRIVNGQTVEFGTSGKLYNSNLVMCDRTSKSLWSQALGEGIVGKYTGIKLNRIPFDLAYWKEWKELYPGTKVLSRDTGSTRPYGADPYGDYYTSSEVLFPVSNHDDRLGQAFDSTLEGQKLDFQYNKNGSMITDKQTGSEWNFDGVATTGPLKGKQIIRLPFDEGFWFEWVAFHPETKLYPG